VLYYFIFYNVVTSICLIYVVKLVKFCFPFFATGCFFPVKSPILNKSNKRIGMPIIIHNSVSLPCMDTFSGQHEHITAYKNIQWLYLV